MSYAIKWRPKALKELRKLPKEFARQIVDRIELAKVNPLHFLERLVDDPGYKVRAGNYRALIDVYEKEQLLVVRIVGHRKNIYKRHL